MSSQTVDKAEKKRKRRAEGEDRPKKKKSGAKGAEERTISASKTVSDASSTADRIKLVHVPKDDAFGLVVGEVSLRSTAAKPRLMSSQLSRPA